MKKIILILLGLALIGGDVWLYFLAQQKSGIFVLLFGLGSAIAVPIGVALITHAFSEKQREAIKKLTKVAEIEDLIEKAESEDQKIKILTNEYKKLEATIKSESTRLSLITRKDDLEKDAKRIIEELDCVESELTAFKEQEISGVPVEEVNKLRERIRAKRSGDIVIRIGRSQFIIEREQILHTPFFGFWLYALLKFWEDLDAALRRSHQGPKL